MVREIITEWSGDGGTEGLSIMYFDETLTVDVQRAGLAALWNDLNSVLNNTTRWTIRTDGRELNDATGVVTGFWSEPTTHTGIGGDAQEPVANVAQGLLRWLTPDVVAGRRVQGRQYIPGISNLRSVSGELQSSAVGVLSAAADAFTAAGVGFGVWHRPQAGVGGSFHLATAGGAWNEFATQRGRR